MSHVITEQTNLMRAITDMRPDHVTHRVDLGKERAFPDALVFGGCLNDGPCEQDCGAIGVSNLPASVSFGGSTCDLCRSIREVMIGYFRRDLGLPLQVAPRGQPGKRILTSWPPLGDCDA
jgi:hypothetical protein